MDDISLLHRDQSKFIELSVTAQRQQAVTARVAKSDSSRDPSPEGSHEITSQISDLEEFQVELSETDPHDRNELADSEKTNKSSEASEREEREASVGGDGTLLARAVEETALLAVDETEAWRAKLSALGIMRDQLDKLRDRNRRGNHCEVREGAEELSSMALRLGFLRLSASAARVATYGNCGDGAGTERLYVSREELDAIEVHLDSAEALWRSCRLLV